MSACKCRLWHPRQRLGQLVMLIASVVSQGISANTMSKLWYLTIVRLLRFGVIAVCGLLLARGREVRHPFHVADHAGQVVQVVAVALGALLQVALVDVPALVAYRVGDVEREIVASLGGRYAQQVAVLLLRKVIFEVHV